MKTSYLKNSVHELPLGRVIILVPHNKITWTREFNKKDRFQSVVEQLESWGGNGWAPNAGVNNTLVLNPEIAEDCSLFKPEKVVKTFVKVMGGAKAQGILIPKGDIFVLPTADCFTLVVSDLRQEEDKGGREVYVRDLMFASHAGRAQLLDEEYIHTGKHPRTNFSVVDSAMEALGVGQKDGSRVEDLSIGVYCGIGPKYFLHSLTDFKYKAKTKRLQKFLLHTYGRKTFRKFKNEAIGVNLFEIIVAQCEKYGIKRSQIEKDKIDTGKARFKNYSGKFPQSELASHRRRTNSRNLIMVQHSREKLESKMVSKKKLDPKDGY